MDDEMARLIAGKKLDELAQKLKAKGVALSITEEAVLTLKGKGITNLYGARELDRVIANDIKPQLAQELLFGKLKKGGKCVLDVKDGEFVFKI
jgi:ATP-dependent Clp protease ATP-binding subunit ClpA